MFKPSLSLLGDRVPSKLCRDKATPLFCWDDPPQRQARVLGTRQGCCLRDPSAPFAAFCLGAAGWRPSPPDRRQSRGRSPRWQRSQLSAASHGKLESAKQEFIGTVPYFTARSLMHVVTYFWHELR